MAHRLLCYDSRIPFRFGAAVAAADTTRLPQQDGLPVTMLLDHGRAVDAIAQDLGLHPATVDRHAQTYHAQGLSGYLQAEQAGYWGLLAPNWPGSARNWTSRCTPTAANSWTG